MNKLGFLISGWEEEIQKFPVLTLIKTIHTQSISTEIMSEMVLILTLISYIFYLYFSIYGTWCFPFSENENIFGFLNIVS